MTTSVSHLSDVKKSCLTLHNIRRFLEVMSKTPGRTTNQYIGKTKEIINLVNALLFDQEDNSFRAFRKIVNPETYITRCGPKQDCQVIQAWESSVEDGWIKRIDVIKWIRPHREDEILIKMNYGGDANLSRSKNDLLRSMDEFLSDNGIQKGPLRGEWDTFVTEPGVDTFKLLSLILVNYQLPLEEEFITIANRHISNIKESLSPKIVNLFEMLQSLAKTEGLLSQNLSIIKTNWSLAQDLFQREKKKLSSEEKTIFEALKR